MENKKIAIMTWYKYTNYGTALQASALGKTLEGLGYQAAFVNYEPKGQYMDKDKFSLVKKVVGKLKNKSNAYAITRETVNLFDEYLKGRITETAPYNSYPELAELNNKFDAFVCGSDQIWSPLCFDEKYFLSFVKDTRKMVPYAPSIGSFVIKNQFIREKISKLLDRFQTLSVREKHGADIIKELTGKEAKVVLDPTMLLTAEEWDSFAETDRCPGIGEDYILCYFLGNSKRYMPYVKRLSKKLGLPVRVIPMTKAQRESCNAVPFEVGPSEFVSLIKNARYVCTDSFHGMLFSINYHKPFSVLKRFKDADRRNQNSRIFSFLDYTGLNDRLADEKSKRLSDDILNCNFENADLFLSEMRDASISYLKSALEMAVESEGTNETEGNYKITDLCCGCGACAAVCPKDAVSVERDENGFEHYKIDSSLCVKCGKCRGVCPMNRVEATKTEEETAKLYSVKSRTEGVLKASSSGGIGYEIARLYLAEGYSICGCVYDDKENCAKHIVVKPGETEKLALLQGSKYLQSVSAEAIREILEISKKSKAVFFGTPCQVAGVEKMLRRCGVRENVVLVDLICHGVPSQVLWDKYISFIDKKHGTGTNPKVVFRDKTKLWRNLTMKIVGNNKIYVKNERKDDFYAFFRRSHFYMNTCFDCPYRDKCSADIRIGDYWGPRFEKDKQGVSMVVANTDLGNKIISNLSDKGACDVQCMDSLYDYLSFQATKNPQKPVEREKMFEELKSDEVDLHKLRKKYCQYDDAREKYSRMLRKIKKFLKRG